MEITLFSGSANLPMAESLARNLGMRLGRRVLERFPDSEVHAEIEESVRGHDVYLIQPTSPPTNEHLMELLLLADACHRAGAERLTAVIPYFGYARQDRRASGRDAVGARLVADLIKSASVQRVLAVDLHTSALEGFFGIPIEHLSAVALLAEAAKPLLPTQSVVVAPDLGAVKLARRYAKLLNLPMAIVHKSRIGGEQVETHGIVGEVRNRSLLIVDDMISTGATIEAAFNACSASGALPIGLVVSTHGLFVGTAAQRLSGLPIKEFLVTDSVATPNCSVPIRSVGLGSLFAEAIKRLHKNESLSEFLIHE
jgi:ribose-phosphate pyrophosphokinase